VEQACVANNRKTGNGARAPTDMSIFEFADRIA